MAKRRVKKNIKQPASSPPSNACDADRKEPPVDNKENAFTDQDVKASLLGTDNLQIRDFVLEEQSDTQILGLQDSLQTPGVTSQRLSVGMTPKTLRLPKHGEMLLSVHGSPLGVYKEDNMEAIHEAEEE